MSGLIIQDHIFALHDVVSDFTIPKQMRQRVRDVIEWICQNEHMEFKDVIDYLPANGDKVFAQALDGSYHILKYQNTGIWREQVSNSRFMQPVLRWAFLPPTFVQKQIQENMAEVNHG